MTQFEYVTTLASFIVAFGVARLLSGWVQQYVRRKEAPIYSLQLAVSALILLALLQNTWAMWLAREFVWTFGPFLLLLLLQLALVGAAALISPPAVSSSDIRDHYFDVRRAVFGLCAAWVTLGGILDFVIWATQGNLGDVPIGVMYTFRGVALLVFVLMAWSDRPSHHWAGFTVAGVLQIGWILSVSYNPGAA